MNQRTKVGFFSFYFPAGIHFFRAVECFKQRITGELGKAASVIVNKGIQLVPNAVAQRLVQNEDVFVSDDFQPVLFFTVKETER